MTVYPSKPRISRISGVLVKSIVWGLDPDTSIIRSLGGYRDWSVSNGVEQNNNYTDRVVIRRNHSLLIIGVRDYIGRRIHVIEHDLIGSKQDSDGSDGWVPILVWVDPFESTIGKWTLDEHGVKHFHLTTNRHILREKGERWFWLRRRPLKQFIPCLISNEESVIQVVRDKIVLLMRSVSWRVFEGDIGQNDWKWQPSSIALFA